jgi:hypothetical protein
MNFEWQTEDEAKWEEAAAESQPAVKRRRGWAAVLVVLLTIGLAGWLAYRQANRQVEQAEASVEADVIAAYRLLHQAAVQSDRELFASLLAASRYPEWAESQLALFDQRLITGLEPVGLRTQLTAPEVVSVTLSPDLTRAELVADWHYGLANGETVVFRRPARMELIGGRWRLARPDVEAWGERQQYTGRSFVMYYPERDRALALRLAADLDRTIEEACQPVSGQIRCDLLLIDLDVRDDSLRQLVVADFAEMSVGRFGISMSTPSLIGVPLSEAGYETLLRAYATYIVVLFRLRLLDCQPFDHPLYCQALMNQELTSLGLNERFADARLYRPEDAPVTLPAEDLQVLCHTKYRGVSDLYRYDLAAGEWTKELSMAGYYATLNPLPGGNGVMVRQQPVYAGETQPRTILWRDGGEAALFQGLYFGAADPAGQRALMYDHQGDWSLVENSMFRYRLSLFDLAECETADDCGGAEVDGFLVWSPDGEHTIIRREGQSLWLGDGNGRPIRSMGLGVNPLWLDEETYAFVNVSRTVVVTATVEVRWRGRLVTLPDLLAAVPEDEPGYGLVIGDVAVSPADPNLLFIGVYSQPQEILPTTRQTGYLFTFNRQTGEVALRLELPGGPRYSPITFSPDGRWLTLSAFDEGQVPRTLYLHDVVTEQTTTIPVYSAYVFPVYQWSAVGDWLALVNDGLLQLIVPESHYQAMVLPEGPGCDFVAWVKP